MFVLKKKYFILGLNMPKYELNSISIQDHVGKICIFKLEILLSNLKIIIDLVKEVPQIW